MSQDLAAVPSTQLELDERVDCRSTNHLSYADEEIQPCTLQDSCPESDSHSCSPSLDTAQCNQQRLAATPQQQQTWSQYSGHMFHNVSPIESQLEGFLIGDRFRMQHIIGQGSFGFTYKALDTWDKGTEVAVKTARGREVSCNPSAYQYDEFLQVEWQAHQRMMIASSGPTTGFPDILAAGIQAFAPDTDDGRSVVKVSFLAMELLGPTCWETVNAMRAQQTILEESSDWSDDEFDSQLPDKASVRVPSTDWIVKTGKGMLKALADVHRHGFIHRDVKTENFCLDVCGSNDTVKIIDFGFARVAYGHYSFVGDYRNRCASFWGTPNYASLSGLMSMPQTPRDDLECLVYCLFEMEHPTLRLPWNNELTTNSEAKDGWTMKQLEKMCKRKHKAWLAACKRGEVPEYLTEYFNYITSLSPQEVPDYQYLMMLLDRGVTGQPPVRPPARRRLSDWPTSDEWDVRRDYAKYAINQVAAAASKILTSPSSMTVQSGAGPQLVQQPSRKRSFASSGHESTEQGHKPCKRVGRVSVVFIDGEFSEEEAFPEELQQASDDNCSPTYSLDGKHAKNRPLGEHSSPLAFVEE